MVFGPHPGACRSRTTRSAIRIPRWSCGWSTAADGIADEGVLEMKCPALMNGYHNRPDDRRRSRRTASTSPATYSAATRTASIISSAAPTTCSSPAARTSIRATSRRMLEWHPGDLAGRRGGRAGRDQGHEAGRFRRASAGRGADRGGGRRAHALAHAPAYAHPRRVFFLPALPLAGTNKIDRRALRQLAMQPI